VVVEVGFPVDVVGGVVEDVVVELGVDEVVVVELGVVELDVVEIVVVVVGGLNVVLLLAEMGVGSVVLLTGGNDLVDSKKK